MRLTTDDIVRSPVVFGALHLHTQPYPFRFQNDIETFLFVANFALVAADKRGERLLFAVPIRHVLFASSYSPARDSPSGEVENVDDNGVEHRETVDLCAMTVDS